MLALVTRRRGRESCGKSGFIAVTSNFFLLGKGINPKISAQSSKLVPANLLANMYQQIFSIEIDKALHHSQNISTDNSTHLTFQVILKKVIGRKKYLPYSLSCAWMAFWAF